MSILADVLDEILADATARGEEASGGEAPRMPAIVVAVEAKLWRDGSLGCAEPGTVYTQAVIEGFRVVVRVGTRDLDYRVDARGNFRLCPDHRTAETSRSPGDEPGASEERDS